MGCHIQADFLNLKKDSVKRKMGFLLASQFLCQPVFVSDNGKGACLLEVWLL